MRAIAIAAYAVCALMVSTAPAFCQNAPIKVLSTAGLNSNLILAGNVMLLSGMVSNSTATVAWLKLYNKSAPPVCGTDIPKWTVMLPANNTTPLSVDGGLMFPSGLGICLTGGIADNDTTAAAAGMSINLGMSKR